MTTAQIGMRVLRGPDWPAAEGMDGGEGHLGTVVALQGGDKVRVLWDNGKQAEYRSGADGKFDLRIFDTAPVGVRHSDTQCAGCEEKNINGMLWRCRVCRSCSLCPLCYVSDKHDIKHDFVRIDEPGHQGCAVKKRSASLKIRALGIFPGAKVKRGKDWVWADQDGGEGNVGEVLGFENVAPDSSRNIVRVRWPHGKTNSYRLGLSGNMDLMCVEEEAGTSYYRDHLPVLSTCGSPSSSSSYSVSDNASLFARSREVTPSEAGATGSTVAPAQVKTGDKVVVNVDEEKLKELQARYGGFTATMLKCIGKQGEVVSFAPNGAVGIKFERLTYRFNPEAISKVPQLSVGDMVRILPDQEQVKLLNKRITWKSGMEEALGKVGQVVKIDSDGDLVVSFGQTAIMFSPACCIPVDASASCDSVASGDSSDSGSCSSSLDSDDRGSELHQDLMKLFAQMMIGLNPQGIGGGSGGCSGGGGSSGDVIQRLLKAVARSDTSGVRTLCQENKGLVNRVYKGMTPLIMACHEGQKDMCACLLAQGADINLAGDKANTPLGAALEGKKEQIALYLLEKGANPNVRNAKQRNPVHLAAYNNLPEVIKVLVQKGAEVNAKDQFGDTPLHDAIERGNADAVDMLLRVKTVDLQAQNKKGFNMLQHAALKDNPHAIERILSRDSGQVDNLLDGHYTALHIAANNDHVECVKLLVKNGGAQVDFEGHNKLTPLHMACLKGHVRSMEALLELGASVNAQDSDGDSTLHMTVGAKVDNPETLLGQMELKNRVRMACVLLSKGAYPDLRNKKGAQPLECCRYPAFRSAVQQFIQENPALIKKAGTSRSQTGLRTTSPRQTSGTGLLQVLQGLTMVCSGPGCTHMSDITLLPCGHKTLCRNCCLQVSECPLCNRTIERRIHKREESEVDLAQACKQM